jgi:hypothetical protein
MNCIRKINKTIVMQNSNQTDQNTQQKNQAGQQQDQAGQQQGSQKESAWRGSSPEDVTGNQAKQDNQPAMEHGRPEQGNPNNAMGNAANRPWEQNKEQNKEQKKDEKKMPNDTDEMGSGKRQDDN